MEYLTKKETEVKLRRVKNKTPASIQITAEQILREAREHEDAQIRPPKRKIIDGEELGDYRLRKRKEFEGSARKSKSVWVKYAKWEESHKDFARARSVWERAIEVDYRDHTVWMKYADFEMKNKSINHARNVWEVDYRDHTVWMKYADFEMKNKSINHARNVWDRATQLLPRVDQLWYKYIHMGNVGGARQIFERWMNWNPDHQGWLSFIKFELRYNEVGRAREIFERFVECHCKVGAWIRFAKFEMKNREIGRARNCYERAVNKLGDEEELFEAFAEFEEKCKETERARCIYKYALDHIPEGRAHKLCSKFLAFQNQYGKE